ncbi:MAG: HD domain-containing protein, partial [Phycisphaerales bacterium]|nr:HD domain-containing protein [Phycisphaerales bacterium]
IPDAILKKPGPLTGAERAEMERHTVLGEALLSSAAFFDTARLIARAHHENFDGTGYPDRRRGDDIPLAARIVRIADVFDALTSNRVYKDAWPMEEALAQIRAGAGQAFDPELVELFIDLVTRGVVGPGSGDQAGLAAFSNE